MAKKLLLQLIYAMISGFSEFFPVSASAHQFLYQILTGEQKPDSALMLAIHIGALAALFVCCKKRLDRFRREKRLAKRTRRSRGRQVNAAVLMDMRLFNTAMVPIIIAVVLLIWSEKWIVNVALLALMLLLNGVVLFFPRLLSQGNKDGRSLSRLDGILMGFGGALAVIPGFSRVGGIVSVGTARGAERSYVLDLALLLSIPALIGLIVIDVYGVVAAGTAFAAATLLLCVLSAAVSFGSAVLSIILIRFIFLKSDGSAFAYYSWGLSLFSFILYLVIQ